MPRAYAYLRVSTSDQALSLGAQREACRAYYDAFLARDFAWGGYYQDPAVSGRKPLLERPAGLALNLAAARGDAIVVAKTDRAFRSSVDTILTMDVWRNRGVGVHLLDLRVDTTTAVGQLLLTVLAGFAQFERARIGERTRDALRHRIATKGPWLNGNALLGFRITRVGSRRTLIPWPEERAYMQTIWKMRHVERLSWRELLVQTVQRKIRSPRTGRGPAGCCAIELCLKKWPAICAREGLDPLAEVAQKKPAGDSLPAGRAPHSSSQLEVRSEVPPESNPAAAAGQGE